MKIIVMYQVCRKINVQREKIKWAMYNAKVELVKGKLLWQKLHIQIRRIFRDYIIINSIYISISVLFILVCLVQETRFKGKLETDDCCALKTKVNETEKNKLSEQTWFWRNILNPLYWPTRNGVENLTILPYLTVMDW